MVLCSELLGIEPKEINTYNNIRVRMNKSLLIPLLFALSLVSASLSSADTFVVKDIRIEGLQRVSAGSLFRGFPINVGDQVDESVIVAATRNLFQNWQFQ